MLITTSSRARRALAAPVLAAVLVAVAGCGSDKKSFSGEALNVADKASQLSSASSAKNASLICNQIFSPSLRQELVTQAGGCEGSIGPVMTRNAGITVEDVNVQGNEAAAKVKDKGGNEYLIHFVKLNGDWRILRFRAP
jgi:hypothetical protein